MENNRFLEIDLMKIIACLAVIAIHISAMGISSPDFGSGVYTASLLINSLSNFAVPAFIFLSGLALMLRYGRSALSFKDFMRKRINSILIPYLGWSFTYFIIYAAAGYYAVNLSNILSVIFLGTGEFHLYFVVILFQLYVLFPFLKPLVTGLHPLLTVLLTVGIHLAFAFGVAPFSYMDRIFVPYLLYFVAGMLWGAHYAVMKDWVQKQWMVAGLLYLSAAALYISSRYHPALPWSLFSQLWQLFSLSAILLLMTLCTAAVPLVRGSGRDEAVTTLSGATFYVYLLHPLLIAGLYKLCADAGVGYAPLTLPLNYLAVTLFSFAGALIYCRYKGARTRTA